MQTVELPGQVRERVAIDIDACIECRSCAAACYYGHNEFPAMHFASVGAADLPAVCRQCPDAACVTACPSDAMRRDASGATYRALFRCTGCGSCVQACPFGIISPAMRRGAVARCDLCNDKLGFGMQPRCVASCPSGALQFMDETLAKELGYVLIGSRTLGEHPVRRR
jgi:Fe-S-cluster-containing hydrogenase component 2